MVQMNLFVGREYIYRPKEQTCGHRGGGGLSCLLIYPKCLVPNRQ